ncbi:patatin-like phospholipase family protein [Wenxinia saemankumensis]|uniref:NTE family protein n=1 Tax=Wenxinia saemankumensis TaxID=1447782 RepID=A0A1M6A664_9RHOB|nr:patatin-like phospholipase family protein [Wenxinia saemankumensis]SHI31936.1 NTE family protein [Wenxinia saemankumensis]
MANPVRLTLALQGGGAHGAFTWGVLDRLLQEDGIEIAAVSGTSAGALNAVALKAGMVAGGAEGARAALAHLWGRVGAVEDHWASDWLAALAPSVPMIAEATQYSPAWLGLDALSRMSSPYVFGEMMKNPLARILSDLDFDAMDHASAPAVFLGATNVRSGKSRVFSGDEITMQAVMASACLPTLFRAVEIEDPATGEVEAYWDGGYTGNPPLHPLYAPDLPDDLVVVQINPIRRDELPRDSQQIANRINEISFNSALLRDLRAIAFVQRLIESGAVARGAMKHVRVHVIANDVLMNELNVATKTIPNPVLLARLKAAGEEAAGGFLAAHRGDLGHRGTCDLRAMFG